MLQRVLQVLHGGMEQHNIKPEDICALLLTLPPKQQTPCFGAMLHEVVALVVFREPRARVSTNVGDIELAARAFTAYQKS